MEQKLQLVDMIQYVVRMWHSSRVNYALGEASHSQPFTARKCGFCLPGKVWTVCKAR